MDLHRSQKKLEFKAKQYRQLKDGHFTNDDTIAEDGLVDFDAKWAQEQDLKSADAASDQSEDDDELDTNDPVEFIDEYGRARQGTRAEAKKIERRQKNKALGAEELGRMSARPGMPAQLIYGDTIQTSAFQPDDEVQGKMRDLAAMRDRSPTPPELKHYEASKEFRIKGVGFYNFSTDEEAREGEMKALEEERSRTEQIRKERDDKRRMRQAAIEDRREVIRQLRAKRVADAFLDEIG